MAVNKNFVVKNGLEVNTRLILADANTNKVGIGSTAPRFELDVAGGIGATDVYVSGITTALEYFNVGAGGNVLSVLAGAGGISTSKVGIGTSNPDYLLEVRSPVSTGHTAVYIHGDVQITGDLNVDDITLDDATLSNLTVTEAFNVVSPGISTFGGYVDINDSLDISTDLNVAGLTTLGGYVDVNAAADFSGTVNIVGVTTIGGYLDVNDSSDISGTLNVGGATTIGGYLDVNDSSDISGTLNVGGATTIGGYTDINADTDINGTLNVSGITTIGTVLITSGIVTATSPSGIVTYYGDGSELLGVIGGIGIGTTGGTLGYGVTFVNFFGAGVSTAVYESSVGIATIFFEGGGGGSISISTVAPTSPGSGDLWYSPDYGRTFIYYDEDVVGYGTDAYWVDAAPFNVGVITSLTNVSFAPGSASNPSLYFLGDSSTGFFSPTPGQFTVVSTGSSILNVNADGVNVTGILTSTTLSTGNVVSSGIVTAQDFDSLSDIRYKENVDTVSDALDKVSQLRGVKFDWKESGLPSYGVIAQELQEVLPELVHGNDPITVNYNGIIGVLIEAIKELKAEVEELKNAK